MLEPENIFFSNAESSSLSKDLNIRLEEIKSGPSLIIVGSTVAHVYVPEQLSKQGLIISDIREAFAKHSELLKKHLDDNANNYGEDRFLSLGLSSFQSGFFIYIPKNLIVPDPIRVVYSLRDDGTSSICRNVVISDVGSKATIVQELYSSTSSSQNLSDVSGVQEGGAPPKNKTQQCYFEVLECGVKPTAELEFITLQAMDPSTINVSNRKAFVEQDGKMSWYSGMFGTSLCRY
jgi:Fe-S cluster assembly scaffold protein SufB